MTAKAQRRAAQNKAKSRRQANKAANSADSSVPIDRPIRLILESIERFSDYATRSADATEAEVLANADLDRSVAELVELSAPYDSFDIIELVRLHNSPLDIETYKETEHEGLMSVVELTALVATARGTRHGQLPSSPDGIRARADAAIDGIQRTALNCINAGAMLSMFRALQVEDQLSRVGLTSMLHEVQVRNTEYPHLLELTLRELFDDPLVRQDCLEALGYDVPTVLDIFDNLQKLELKQIQTKFEPMKDYRDVMMQILGLERAADEQGVDVTGESDYSVLHERAAYCWNECWSNPSDASLIDLAAITSASGIPESDVRAVLEDFSFNISPAPPLTIALDFLSGKSPLQYRPVIRDPDGSAIVVHDGLLIPAIRYRMEQGLKAAGKWQNYSKHRGDYLENAAVRLLEPHLPGAVIYRGLEYFVPDESSSTLQAAPADFTILVENDALFIIDDIAIVLEAKAGSFTTRSRAGDLRRLRSDLTKLITDASKQGNRMRTRIDTDHGLRLRDGSWLDLDNVREVHVIAVTLDNLSGVTTVTAELANNGLIPGAYLPWTVSLHDLRVISDLLARPAELLLYLQRRTDPEATLKFGATDELDLFLNFYARGLYVYPDPVRVSAELPQFGVPRVGQKRRRANQGRIALTSMTDSLDTWYLYRLGIRASPAQKPAFNAGPGILQIIDELAAQKYRGWLSTGALLLAGSAEMMKKCAKAGSQVARQTRRDGEMHSITMIGGTTQASSYVLTWMCQPDSLPRQQALSRLTVYLQAKKHQAQVARGIGLLYDAEAVNLVTMVYDNRRPGSDENLDRIGAMLSLRRL